MIDTLATVMWTAFIVAISYRVGHEDGRDAEYAERWDLGE